MVIYELNFSIKIQLLRVSRRKSGNFFPAGPFLLVLYMTVYQSALILRKLPCPKNVLITRMVSIVKSVCCCSKQLNWLVSVSASFINLTDFGIIFCFYSFRFCCLSSSLSVPLCTSSIIFENVRSPCLRVSFSLVNDVSFIILIP